MAQGVKGLADKLSDPSLLPRMPHDRGRELTPAICPLTSSCKPGWPSCVHACVNDGLCRSISGCVSQAWQRVRGWQRVGSLRKAIQGKRRWSSLRCLETGHSLGIISRMQRARARSWLSPRIQEVRDPSWESLGVRLDLGTEKNT